MTTLPSVRFSFFTKVMFPLNQHNSFRKVLEYHEAALSSSTPENQLLNLWAGLEGFLPPKSRPGARIDYYLGILLPVLTLTYAEKILTYLSFYLKSHSSSVRELVSKVDESKSPFENVIAVVACEEMGETREELVELLGNNPLLRNRFFWCRKNFRSTESIFQILRQHRKRVEWHLRRIYATRNLITHSAETLPYVQTLVENLHSYIDLLIEAFVRVAVRTSVPVRAGGITTTLSLHEESHLRWLKSARKECTVENHLECLFGEKSPLLPEFKHSITPPRPGVSGGR